MIEVPVFLYLPLYQFAFLFLFLLANIWIFVTSFQQVRMRNSFGLTPNLIWMGSFVWADAVVFSLFWILTSLICIILHDWLLFWLATSLFWSIRSFGETMYWLHEQFSTRRRNPPETLKFHTFFQDESIWFIYQIVWQCATVFSLIASIYFASRWIQHLLS